ncbi:serine protease [Asbolus verrucosus]|uniref:Serine protease n=1 Tax=Asbolus verrucosus TaxID=1661398 RepID=A0A482W011_ASBVE|nr:serine protease [Asbolus verrucosus]
MAFLYSQFNNSSSYCGGTLIDNKHILTAAHCVVNASDVHVVLGTSKIGTYEEPSKIILSMKKSIIHEDYNSNGYDNDIALLQLDENVQLNEYINVVSLSTEKKMFTMEDAFSVLGWGVPNSPSELNDKLLIKNVNLADSEECFSFFKLEDFIVDYSKVICTLSEEGPCHSDSGGPLILGDTQIGVLSAGERNCTPNTPVRYMNVGYYRIIIGGDEVVPHSVPYQVGLRINGNQYFCGGALISANYVLTAAHCAEVMRSVDVILGAHNITNSEEDTQVKIPGQQIIIHENYNGTSYLNDITLIKLNTTVTFNDNIQPVALPSDSSANYVGQIGKATGWGLVKDVPFPTISDMSDVLMGVDVEVDDLEDCASYYNDEEDTYITATNICTSGYRNKGTCNGDSGGPVVLNGIIIGVTSFGTTECEMCTPSVYTDVGKYLDWIAKNSDVKI